MSNLIIISNIQLLKTNKNSVDSEIFNLRRRILEKKKEIKNLEDRLLTLSATQERLTTNIKYFTDCNKILKYVQKQ